jgi:5'-nucleotidase
MHSVRLNGLAIEKAVFCQGRDRFVYAKAIRADLFLSVNPQDVVSAISHGVPAATIVARRSESRGASNEIRLAFDGDSVLFDESSDALYKLVGLDRWRDHEETNAMVPLGDGPFRSVFEKLHQVRDSLGDDSKGLIRLALVTARGAPAHERAIQTLTSWGLSVDEAIFAAGMPKGPLLQAFGADFFFDDLASNIDSASSCSVPAGHVPFGNGGITV